jgi:hypothetical protein
MRSYLKNCARHARLYTGMAPRSEWRLERSGLARRFCHSERSEEPLNKRSVTLRLSYAWIAVARSALLPSRGPALRQPRDDTDCALEIIGDASEMRPYLKNCARHARLYTGMAPRSERRPERSAFSRAADKFFDATVRVVIGHLQRRMLGEIGRGGMKDPALAAIQPQFAAADGIDRHPGGIR